MDSKIKKPVPFGEVMNALFVRLGIADGVKQQQALLIWSEVVGEAIAKVSTPVRIEHGRMYVQIEHGAWRQEIHFYKKMIIDRLNKKLQKNVVKEIILV